MSEYMFSNEFVTIAINLEDGSWRVVGPGTKSLFFEADTGKILASFNNAVGLLEDENVLLDYDQPVPYEIQSPSAATQVEQQGLTSALYIEANTRGQFITPTLLFSDDDSTTNPEADPTSFITLPAFVTHKRDVQRYTGPWSSRILGVRLTGMLTDRVDIYGVELDVDAPPGERNQ